MLYLRFGEVTLPTEIDCELCAGMIQPGNPVYTQEVQVDKEDTKREQIVAEFITLCSPCYSNLKRNAEKFKLHMVFDRPPEDQVKLAVGFKEKNF